MRLFGWCVAVVMLLGMFGIIDAQVCIAGKGRCEVTKK